MPDLVVQRSRCLGLGLAVASVTACISTTGTLQTAETVPKGGWQVGAGVTVPVSTRFASELADLVSQAHDELTDGDPITEEDEREAIVSALGLLLFQPSVVVPLSVRRGVVEDVDVGFRLAGPAMRLDGKWRFISSEEGPSLALDAGFTYHTGIASSVASSVFDLFESLELVSYSRRDLDVNLLASTNPKRRFGFFGAARYTAAFTSVETRLDDVGIPDPPLRDTKTTMHLAGGSAGVRVGSTRVALLAELSVMRVLFEPEVFGEKRDLGGWIIEPSLGLTADF